MKEVCSSSGEKNNFGDEWRNLATNKEILVAADENPKAAIEGICANLRCSRMTGGAS